MEWTTEKPSNPGWYWYQQDSEFPECLLLYKHHDDGLCVVTGTNVHTVDDFHALMMEEEHDIRWAGPIPEPTERTEGA